LRFYSVKGDDPLFAIVLKNRAGVGTFATRPKAPLSPTLWLAGPNVNPSTNPHQDVYYPWPFTNIEKAGGVR
jgi:hypothetical protein